jgi:STE24 endopeptidase
MNGASRSRASGIQPSTELIPASGLRLNGEFCQSPVMIYEFRVPIYKSHPATTSLSKEHDASCLSHESRNPIYEVRIMNLYAAIILFTLLFEYILDWIADLLNLSRLSGGLPDEFRDVYDEAQYRKSREYTRVNTKYGWITSSFDLAAMLAFWFLGGFNWLDQIVRSWHWHPVPTGLVYIGVLVLLKTVLSLPFSIYDTFVIEEKFGFNKTTPRTFILDLLKGLFLAAVLGGPLLAGLLAFFQYAGQWAWVFCWIAVALFSLFVQFIAPTWIMPLFNKFTPLPDGELNEKILGYARSVRYPVKGIFVMDGSKRSGKSNAFFTGFGKNKRIVLYDTLIEKHIVPEMVSILAHEIGHFKLKHIPRRMAMGIVHTGIVFFLLSIFLQERGLFDAFRMKEASVYAGFLFFGMLYASIEFVLSIFMHMLSRRDEIQADRFAAQTTKTPDAFVSALKKLTAHNLVNLKPHPVYVFLNYSHPPILERIQRILALRKNRLPLGMLPLRMFPSGSIRSFMDVDSATPRQLIGFPMHMV